MADGIDMAMAMKLVHSSNSKRQEDKKDPLVKDVISQVGILGKKIEESKEYIVKNNDEKTNSLKKEILDIKQNLKSLHITDDILESNSDTQDLVEEVAKNTTNNINQSSGIISSLINIVRNKKEKNEDESSDSEEDDILISMSGGIRNTVTKTYTEIKNIINYLKFIHYDILQIHGFHFQNILSNIIFLKNLTIDFKRDVAENNQAINSDLENISSQNLKTTSNVSDIVPSLSEDFKELNSKNSDAFINNIPTPVVDATKINLPEPIVNLPEPIVNVPAPVVDATKINLPEPIVNVPTPVVNFSAPPVDLSKMNPISEMVNSILDEIFKYVYMGYVELLSIKNHIFSLNNKNDDGDHFIDEMLKNNNIVNSMISKISNQSLSKEDTMELLNKLSDEQFEILTKMDNLPDHVGDCVSDIQRHQKLSEFRIGQKLLGVENKLLSFDQNIKKRFKSLVNFVSNPLGFIKTIFTTVGRIISLMWKTIIPTLVSLAVTFFMTVLPVILMVLGIVILTVITLFLVWKHFGKYIKQFWDFIKEHVVNYIVMVWNILKEVVFWIWDTVKFVWGVLVDVYDFIDAIFSGDFTGAMKIVSRLMDRIVSYISSTFETIFNIFQHFGDFLSKLPIIGPVFKFLFDILMPFMRFFIEAFKWTYSFIKDGISVIWDNFKDAISLIKAIFSGDFSGAMVIVSNMFDRIVNFLVEKIISVLIILQDLGNSLMIPISWLWDSFKVAWDYYSKIISEVYDWIIGIFKIGWDSVKLVIDGIWASLQKVFNFITDIPGKLLGGVKDVVGGLGKALNPFNWFADGGIVTGPTQAVIGEAGPEAVLPLSGSGNNTLMGVLNSFFDTFLPFFKPLITFLWDNFKPYLPIMQSVMDAIYSVVYSIISGLSNLPQWLGGGIFADMLSKMTSPSGGGSGGKSVSAVDNAAFVSLISGEIGDMPMLSVVGKDKAQITTLDVSKGPIVNPTFKDVKDFVSGSSEKMEVPEFARSLQNGIESIHKGIETLSSKIDEVGKSIGNIGGDGGGSVQPANDTQFEMLKFISRSNFNGSRI